MTLLEKTVKSQLIDGWGSHLVKQGDGKGGWVEQEAEYARLTTVGGGCLAYGLVRMENDHVAIVASWIFREEGKKHERPVMAISKDGGRTWGDFIVVPNSTEPIARPTTASYLGKGKLALLAGGRRHFTNDYGKTWEYVPQAHPSRGWTAGGEGNQLVDLDADGVATRIAEFGHNRWIVDKVPDAWRIRDVSAKIGWSKDGGRTWGDAVEPKEWHYDVAHDSKTYRRGFVEGSFTRAANGWIVAGLRTDILPQYFYQPPPCKDNFSGTAVSVSKNDGKTWSPPQMLFDAGRHHPNVQLLPNGDVVLTVIVRVDIQNGKLASYRHGCEAVISHDNGLTWDLGRRYIVDDFEHGTGYSERNRYDGYKCVAGHVCSASLSDGTILTSYGNYLVSGIPLIRWKPPPD